MIHCIVKILIFVQVIIKQPGGNRTIRLKKNENYKFYNKAKRLRTARSLL